MKTLALMPTTFKKTYADDPTIQTMLESQKAMMESQKTMKELVKLRVRQIETEKDVKQLQDNQENFGKQLPLTNSPREISHLCYRIATVIQLSHGVNKSISSIRKKSCKNHAETSKTISPLSIFFKRLSLNSA